MDLEIKLLWYDGIPGAYGSGLNFTSLKALFIFEILNPGNEKENFLSPSDIWTYQNMDQRVITGETNFQNLIISTIKMPLVRKQEYYVWTIFLPLEMLMVLQLGTFIMPPDVFDRGTYSITVNLAFAVTQQVINGQMPKTSQRIYLSYYIAAYLAIGIFVTIYSLAIATTSQGSTRKIWGGRVTKSRAVDLLVLLITLVAALASTFAYFAAVVFFNQSK